MSKLEDVKRKKSDRQKFAWFFLYMLVEWKPVRELKEAVIELSGSFIWVSVFLVLEIDQKNILIVKIKFRKQINAFLPFSVQIYLFMLKNQIKNITIKVRRNVA